MKKLVVVVCGWHYSDYFYKQLPSQKVPDDWEVDYFCISHRNPKYAIGEKDLKVGSDNLLELLNCFYYKDIATIESIESYGWKYIEKPNTLGDWGVYNQWAEDYDYTDYDMFLLSGDDNFIIRDDLLDLVLGNKLTKLYSNGDVGNYVRSEVDYNDNWLVLSNNCPQGRGMIRGSFEFIKRKVMDDLGGKFDFSGCDMEARLNNTSTKGYGDAIMQNWNMQCVQFMKYIENNNLYPRIRFLSPNYRVSKFCIEGERGVFSNSHVSPESFRPGVLELYEKGRFDRFL
jgi:hypothetical protein